jgi:hypothetical protein
LTFVGPVNSSSDFDPVQRLHADSVALISNGFFVESRSKEDPLRYT